MDTANRFDRNERLFGKEGQAKLRATHVAVIGVGGLGTHVVQQLALLGIGALSLVDPEELSASNRNRYIGARHDDPVPGLPKVTLGERLAREIDPDIAVTKVHASFLSEAALKPVRTADFVFGCVDNDGVRHVLNEACLAYDTPLIDLASDVPESGYYGGRVTFVAEGNGCLHCRELLDDIEVRRFLTTDAERHNEAAVYGIREIFLADDGAGPSVVSVNGVVASLGVTEFKVAATGMREPNPHLEYRGNEGVVRKRVDQPAPDCHYCQNIRGKGDAADITRYFNATSPAAA